jgi:hypothetical protein
MAVVYRAFDLKIPRLVALKVLHREFAAYILRDRFLQEIRTIARLTHPNILPLYDADEVAGWLYYVTPLMAEGTLRDRLARIGRLPLAEVLDLARQVGAALTFAHGHTPQIIHRDIKPGNILLAGSHAFLADFGIAQVSPEITGRAAEPLTETGLRLGTPGYMSPEQLRGQRDLDGRSDQFSLAVVLCELLTGFTPSRPTADASHDAVDELAHERRDVPRQVLDALRRALTVDRGGRFPTVADFLAALTPAATPPDSADARRLPRAVPIADHAPVTPDKRLRYKLGIAWLALLVVGALLAPRVPTAVRRLFSRPAELDTTRYAVLPFAYDSGVATLNERSALRDALASRWSGIGLVEEFREAEMLNAHATKAWNTSDALQAALALGAGRFLRGTVTRVGDSLRILAGLYDATRGGTQLSFATSRLPPDTREASRTFGRIAELLVLRDALPPDSATDRLGSRSLPAVQAFAAGMRALRGWNLPAADVAFDEAISFDRDFTRAYLWLGLVRQWEPVEPGSWRSAAERAGSGRSTLDGREQLLADALLASARSTPVGACRGWRRLTERDPGDFVAWYGSGFCQARDSIVVRDPMNPGGWRFRSSYYDGLRGLVRAFRLHPEILSAYRDAGYAALRDLFLVDPNRFRQGRSLDGQLRFTAFPIRAADTLAFEPLVTSTVVIPDRRSAADRAAASIHQRHMLLDVTEAWIAAAPDDPHALEAKGIALDLLGRRDAIETLRHAMTISHDPADRLRVGQSLTWLILKESLPEDTAGLERGLALIDSLLVEQSPATTSDPVGLAGLAILTGRAHLAAAYLRAPQALTSLGVPPEVGGLATTLLIYASVGGPGDSLDRLTGRLRAAISRIPDPPFRGEATAAWLGRAATLAYPVHPLPGISDLAGLGDPLFDAQAADQRGDAVELNRLLARLGEMRANTPPNEVTFDALYPEAALRARAGDRVGAAAWIDSALTALDDMATDPMADPIRAAGLVPTLVFRADLAAEAGDSITARRWARPASRLWRDCDPFLRPTLVRMQSLAR